MLKVLLGLALVASGASAAEDQAPAPSCKLVPGWTQDGAARSYTAENLFEYMDGNSEGYLIYGFQKMLGVTCKKGEITFVIDISDMGDSDSAYGLFSSNRDLRQPMTPIGMGGQIVPRRAIFAKGKYYLEIAANPEGDHTAALKEWTAALARTVAGNSSLPAALSWFPAEKQQTLRLVPESVLGMRILTRGYVGQYEYGKAFVVLEDSPESAGAVMGKLKARLGETTATSIADEAFQANDKYLGKLCVFRKGRYVAGWAIPADGVDPLPLSRKLAETIR